MILGWFEDDFEQHSSVWLLEKIAAEGGDQEENPLGLFFQDLWTHRLLIRTYQKDTIILCESQIHRDKVHFKADALNVVLQVVSEKRLFESFCLKTSSFESLP